MTAEMEPPLALRGLNPSPPRALTLPAEIQEMILAEVAHNARDVRSGQEWRGLVGNCLCINWAWNRSLAHQLLRNCDIDIEMFLAFAPGPIAEKAIDRWIGQVGEETRAKPRQRHRALSPASRSRLETKELRLGLLLAASRGLVGCLHALASTAVGWGIGIAETSLHSTSILREAVRSGKLGVVNFLLDRGVGPRDRDAIIPDWAQLPIAMAVQRLHVDIAAAILAFDPVPDQGYVLFRDDECARSARVDDIDCWCLPGRESEWRLERLRYEIDRLDVVVKQIGDFGFAECQHLELVSWAAYRSSMPMLKLLVERYSFTVDVERDLYWAFRGGADVDVIRLLLQHGKRGEVAAPVLPNDFLLSRYRIKSKPRSGAAGNWDPEFTRSYYDMVPLRQRVPVIDAVTYCNVDMVKLLLDTLSDAEEVNRTVNEFDPFWRTPLHYAVEKGDQDMVRYLLECGAEVWQSCFDLVSREGSTDTVGLVTRWMKEHDLEVKQE
ncbi:ankyrin repeat-containing protein [Blastomyces dermatitidis ATCC 18188]|nr:ankyrin repeat-containing protein [Blastomyces dermatitidis ATCC 18188]